MRIGRKRANASAVIAQPASNRTSSRWAAPRPASENCPMSQPARKPGDPAASKLADSLGLDDPSIPVLTERLTLPPLDLNLEYRLPERPAASDEDAAAPLTEAPLEPIDPLEAPETMSPLESTDDIDSGETAADDVLPSD